MNLIDDAFWYLCGVFHKDKDERGQFGSVEWLISLVVAVFICFLLYKLVIAIAADS